MSSRALDFALLIGGSTLIFSTLSPRAAAWGTSRDEDGLVFAGIDELADGIQLSPTGRRESHDSRPPRAAHVVPRTKSNSAAAASRRDAHKNHDTLSRSSSSASPSAAQRSSGGRKRAGRSRKPHKNKKTQAHHSDWGRRPSLFAAFIQEREKLALQEDPAPTVAPTNTKKSRKMYAPSSPLWTASNRDAWFPPDACPIYFADSFASHFCEDHRCELPCLLDKGDATTPATCTPTDVCRLHYAPGGRTPSCVRKKCTQIHYDGMPGLEQQVSDTELLRRYRICMNAGQNDEDFKNGLQCTYDAKHSICVMAESARKKFFKQVEARKGAGGGAFSSFVGVGGGDAVIGELRDNAGRSRKSSLRSPSSYDPGLLDPDSSGAPQSFLQIENFQNLENSKTQSEDYPGDYYWPGEDEGVVGVDEWPQNGDQEQQEDGEYFDDRAAPDEDSNVDVAEEGSVPSSFVEDEVPPGKGTPPSEDLPVAASGVQMSGFEGDDGETEAEGPEDAHNYEHGSDTSVEPPVGGYAGARPAPPGSPGSGIRAEATADLDLMESDVSKMSLNDLKSLGMKTFQFEESVDAMREKLVQDVRERTEAFERARTALEIAQAKVLAKLQAIRDAFAQSAAEIALLKGELPELHRKVWTYIQEQKAVQDDDMFAENMQQTFGSAKLTNQNLDDVKVGYVPPPKDAGAKGAEGQKAAEAAKNEKPPANTAVGGTPAPGAANANNKVPAVPDGATGAADAGPKKEPPDVGGGGATAPATGTSAEGAPNPNDVAESAMEM